MTPAQLAGCGWPATRCRIAWRWSAATAATGRGRSSTCDLLRRAAAAGQVPPPVRLEQRPAPSMAASICPCHIRHSIYRQALQPRSVPVSQQQIGVVSSRSNWQCEQGGGPSSRTAGAAQAAAQLLGCTAPLSTRYGTSAASQGASPRHMACAKPKCGLFLAHSGLKCICRQGRAGRAGRGGHWALHCRAQVLHGLACCRAAAAAP